MKKELCKCKRFSGYTVGYKCRACKKPIYTKKQAEEIDEARRLESETKRAWEKANLTDADIAYWCGEHNGRLDATEGIKDILRDMLSEMFTFGRFISADRAERLMRKIDNIGIGDNPKLEISMNMLCPRCGLAGHSPEDYEKCVTKRKSK